MDEATGLPVINMTFLKGVRELASSPQTVARVAEDPDTLGMLVLLMDGEDEPMVILILQILKLVAYHKEYRPIMRGFLGMMTQLQVILNNTNTPAAIYQLADKLYNQLQEAPNNSNHGNRYNNPLHDIKDTSVNQPKTETKTSQRTRRNSMLVRGGLGKSGKMITLQIRGMADRDDMDLCRNLLVKVKGVISITFDFKKKRSILRCRNDLNAELLAQAIAKSFTMTAEQVIRDDDGEEVLVSFSSKLSAADKENEEMPDYPTDEDSPIRGDKNLARQGKEAADSPGWGFMKSIGNVITNSFYW